MNIEIAYKILEYIVISEVVLIILIILFTYIFELIIYLNEKYNIKTKITVENFLLKKINSNNKNISKEEIPNKWKKLPLLFPIILKFDEKYKENSTWKILKNFLLIDLMLPMARKYADSKKWVLRFYSCEILGLVGEKKDNEIITKLTKDPIPLVQAHSITAAIQSCSKEGINNIIDQIAESGWITQSLYLEPFKNSPIEIRNLIESRLNESTKPTVRASCYKILLQFPPLDIAVNVDADMKSTNYELRIAALKYITYFDKEAAIPVLLKSIKDKSWEVRLIAIHRLGKLQIKDALSSFVKCLEDPDWLVRFGAAEALKSLGKEGEDALKSRAPQLMHIPFDATKHIKHTLW